MSVVGIDLGTTNTVVACVRNGRVHVLADEQGRKLLPSVVAFHPNGQVLVGHTAKARRAVDAKNTIASVKRLLGRPWNSPELEKARARFTFEMREGPGQGPLVVARGHEYTLPEISAFILRRAKDIAEAALGEPVERAVITVPAHFNELQRAATKVAGRVAGLEVLRIVNEPTAAALAYGLGKGGNERIAVYDFGGGTFDSTLLDLNGNVFEVLATAGDPFLGGDDLDDAIADRMADAFLLQHRFDPRVDPQSHERLRQAAENLKCELSGKEQAQVHLREVAFGAGGSHLDLVFGLTSHELEKMAEPLLERTLKVTQDALALARLTPTSFDRTILVGGSTRIPLVRRRVEAFFGAPPMDRMNPDEVVAIGAAIQAAALTDAARRRSIPPAPKRKSSPSIPDALKATGLATAPLDAEDDAETQAMHRSSFPPENMPPSSSPQTQRGLSANPPPVAPVVPMATTTARIPNVPVASPIPPAPLRTHTQPMPPPPAMPAGVKPFGMIEEPSLVTGSYSGIVAPVQSAEQPQPPAPPPPPPLMNLFAPEAGRYQSQPPRAPVFTASMPPPVLIDVTPRGLVVETVGGFCDTIIPRNAKIPCERSRAFSTAHDGQQTVRIRVAQGEEKLFGNNTFLGEVELAGLRQAPRGEVSVAVTFELDAGGSLRVRAKDPTTGREATATLQLLGIARESQIFEMQQRMAAHPISQG